MQPISDVIEIQISRETKAISQAGFGTGLVVGESNKLPALDIVTVVLSDDLITGNTLVMYLNGELVDDAAMTFDTDHDTTVAAIAVHIATLDGVASCIVSGPANRVLTITSEADEPVLVTHTIVTGGASQPVVTVERVAATRIRFYSDITSVLDDFAATDREYIAAQSYFSANPSPSRIAIGAKRASDPGWTSAMAAIANENNEWYGLVITSRTPADIETVAALIEAQPKLFGNATFDANTLLAAADTDIGSVLQASAYERTWTIYNDASDGSALDPFPDAAFFGKMFPTIPGSATWAYKLLAGVPVSELTATESQAALGKNVNTYEPMGGNNITRYGTMASGEFIDIMRGVDWLAARMQEAIFGRLVNLPKIPFTDKGIAVAELEIRGVLLQGIKNGLISPDTKFTVTVPKAADVSINDRANRQLTDIEFWAPLAGAVHKFTAHGVVSV